MKRARVIDSHHHLWAYQVEEFGWISEDMAALRRDFGTEDLVPELRGAGVDGTVLVQARQTVAETEWLLGIAESSAEVLGVVGWLPIASEEFLRDLEKLSGHSWLKGLRHVVQAEEPGFLDDVAFNRGISGLLPTGLVYDLLIHSGQMAEAIRFVDRHPKQVFVLDHIGKPGISRGEMEPWKGLITDLAKRENVSCKVSGMLTEADWLRWSPEGLLPYFEVVLEAFGADRLLFGSDWPVLTVGSSYLQWVEVVRAWVADLSERDMILGGNAERIYKLKTVGK